MTFVTCDIELISTTLPCVRHMSNRIMANRSKTKLLSLEIRGFVVKIPRATYYFCNSELVCGAYGHSATARLVQTDYSDMT